jgi:hypothetical protein
MLINSLYKKTEDTGTWEVTSMFHFILFLHILGGFGMGFYLLFPILCFSLGSLSVAVQSGYIRGLRAANHYAALLLFAQLITGTYLMFHGNYKTEWIIAVSVLFLSMGPLTGVIRKQFRTVVEHFNAENEANNEISNIRKLSLFTCLIMIAILILMVYPQ